MDGLARLENSIRTNQLNSQATLTVFLDISQAFDSVSHNLLLHKIQSLHLDGNLACFIQDFLFNRTIKVRNDNILSSQHPSPIGLPQGSVISPTLFNIFINDIFSSPFRFDFDFSLFADDIAIWVNDKDPNKCIQKAQQILYHIEMWSSNNGLKFSPTKTKALFSTKKKVPNIPLTLYNHPIEYVKQHKFLGITMDRNLTWKDHIKDLRLRCEA